MSRTAATRVELGAGVRDDYGLKYITIGRCHSAIRANCHRIVARETPTHEYATIANWSGAV